MYRFGSFLFGGFMIPLRDLYWPFEVFYYIMPYSYYIRSYMFQYFSASEFANCNPAEALNQAVCVEATTPFRERIRATDYDADARVPGKLVLGQLSNVFPLLSTEDETVKDFAIIIAVGLFFKIIYIAGVLMKTSKVSKFVSSNNSK